MTVFGKLKQKKKRKQECSSALMLIMNMFTVVFVKESIYLVLYIILYNFNINAESYCHFL